MPDYTERRRTDRGADRLLFIAAIFGSAFLIFLVQPMLGKRILPWFGGTPGVWSLCLAFYQTTLFAGYAYAHLLIRFARPAAQLGIHSTAILAAIAVLPVLPGDEWRPTGLEHPSGDILEILITHIALPFLVLASTGPLVQAWYARRHPDRSPYPLYAVSNAGSLLALFSYPFILEPRMTLSATGTGWSLAFPLVGLSVAGCALLALRGEAAHSSEIDDTASTPAPRIEPLRVTAWFLLSGCAVVVMMGVTNKLCLDVASVPFLWILPLSAYLLSFIICFASDRTYARAPYALLAGLAFLTTLARPVWERFIDVSAGGLFASAYVQIPAYCLLLFGTCMVMHGELYRIRPAPRRLTLFYLCVSGGGAMGGVFVGILAPLLFDDYFELPFGLALAALLLLAACAADPKSVFSARQSRGRLAILVSVVVASLSFSALSTADSRAGLIHRERSFFGVLRVVEQSEGDLALRILTSGSTLHGAQLLGDQSSRWPMAYYGRATAIGLLMAKRNPDRPVHVGIIGLGIGTLSAYGRENDLFRYYEIDPAVLRIARNDGYFSYLKESRAETEVVLGDARLSLATEQHRGERQDFDILVLDAFNSDAIPVHLLTEEAFRIYTAALAPNGILAIHISNRHFDLMPLIARQGFGVGFHSLLVESAQAPAYQSHRALWVVLAPKSDDLHGFAKYFRRRIERIGLPPQHLGLTEPLPGEVASVPLWTDEYSDLLGALRPK